MKTLKRNNDRRIKLSETIIENLPYRPCVGILLLNSEGKAFVGQRLDRNTSAWQMPQGGIEKDEKPIDAALRELEEETGTSSVRVVSESTEWLRYDLPTNMVDKLWKGQYRGQTQKWFAMEFLGEEREIDPRRVASPEFSNWQWANTEQLPSLVVAFKRDIYKIVINEFRDVISSIKQKNSFSA